MSSQPAVLQVVILRDGLLVGTEVFVPGSYVLGSADDADLRLDDAAVDPHHAVLYFQNGKAAVQDSGSVGGLYVNGHQVTACEIRSVDEVVLGPFVLKTRVLGPRTTPKTTPPPEVSALLGSVAPAVIPQVAPISSPRRPPPPLRRGGGHRAGALRHASAGGERTGGGNRHGALGKAAQGQGAEVRRRAAGSAAFLGRRRAGASAGEPSPPGPRAPRRRAPLARGRPGVATSLGGTRARGDPAAASSAAGRGPAAPVARPIPVQPRRATAPAGATARGPQLFAVPPRAAGASLVSTSSSTGRALGSW